MVHDTNSEALFLLVSSTMGLDVAAPLSAERDNARFGAESAITGVLSSRQSLIACFQLVESLCRRTELYIGLSVKHLAG